MIRNPGIGVLVLATIWIAAFAIPSVLYVWFARNPRPRGVGKVCFLVHVCLVCLFTIDSLRQTSSEGALMGWVLFDILDFPASLVHISLDLAFTGSGAISFGLRSFWLPCIGSLIVGSLQWGLIGMGVAALWRRGMPSHWEKRKSNQASHATSEPAPGADSSSREG